MQRAGCFFDLGVLVSGADIYRALGVPPPFPAPPLALWSRFQEAQSPESKLDVGLAWLKAESASKWTSK